MSGAMPLDLLRTERLTYLHRVSGKMGFTSNSFFPNCQGPTTMLWSKTAAIRSPGGREPTDTFQHTSPGDSGDTQI